MSVVFNSNIKISTHSVIDFVESSISVGIFCIHFTVEIPSEIEDSTKSMTK